MSCSKSTRVINHTVKLIAVLAALLISGQAFAIKCNPTYLPPNTSPTKTGSLKEVNLLRPVPAGSLAFGMSLVCIYQNPQGVKYTQVIPPSSLSYLKPVVPDNFFQRVQPRNPDNTLGDIYASPYRNRCLGKVTDPTYPNPAPPATPTFDASVSIADACEVNEITPAFPIFKPINGACQALSVGIESLIGHIGNDARHPGKKALTVTYHVEEPHNQYVMAEPANPINNPQEFNDFWLSGNTLPEPGVIEAQADYLSYDAYHFFPQIITLTGSNGIINDATVEIYKANILFTPNFLPYPTTRRLDMVLRIGNLSPQLTQIKLNIGIISFRKPQEPPVDVYNNCPLPELVITNPFTSACTTNQPDSNCSQSSSVAIE